MSPRLAAAALLLSATLATAPLIAQGSMPSQPPGTPDVKLVTAGTYKADPHHTLVEWQVNHLGFSPYFGLFGDISGTLTIDPRALEKTRVDVTIPIAKVTTASPGLTAHLLKAPKAGEKPDFFGPSPTDARFVSTTVKRTGAMAATVTGDLTLNGVTKPVTLAVRFYGAGTMDMGGGPSENLGFSATGTIQRSQFGLGFSVPLVSDAVELKIAAAFIKDKGAAK